jgi:hypothetical protein
MRANVINQWIYSIKLRVIELLQNEKLDMAHTKHFWDGDLDGRIILKYLFGEIGS